MSRELYCPNRSSVKLKVYFTNGKKETFYSFFRDEKRGDDFIIEALKRRILKNHLNENYNVAIVYDNRTGEEKKRFTGKQYL